MKIGILSDTHDHLSNLRRALEIFKAEGCERVLHAGDFISPFVLKLFREYALPLTGVFGNNDGELLMLVKVSEGIGEIRKGPIELAVAGRKTALMHEPVFLDALAKSGQFELIVYGHTHQPKIAGNEGQGPLLINPGAACGIMTEKPTAAICDLEKMNAKLIEL